MNISQVLLLSAIMGLSILISYPLVVLKKRGRTGSSIFTAFAVGILLFLVADIFQGASTLLYNNSLLGYGTNTEYDIVFIISIAAGFFMLYAFEFRSAKEISPLQVSLLISIGIGLQNLTEGMVFGSEASAIGLTGVALVVFTGFILQNITEGFPIGSPFIGNSPPRKNVIPLFFLIGGIPTIIGGGVGFYFNSAVFDLIFDGLAVGAIIYIILPMASVLFAGSRDRMIKRYTYVSVFLGFILGMVVNFL